MSGISGRPSASGAFPSGPFWCCRFWVLPTSGRPRARAGRVCGTVGLYYAIPVLGLRAVLLYEVKAAGGHAAADRHGEKDLRSVRFRAQCLPAAPRLHGRGSAGAERSGGGAEAAPRPLDLRKSLPAFARPPIHFSRGQGTALGRRARPLLQHLLDAADAWRRRGGRRQAGEAERPPFPLHDRHPVEQHGEACAVGMGDSAAVDLEVARARGAQRVQTFAARPSCVGEGQRAARGEPARRGDHDLEGRGTAAPPATPTRRSAHEPLPAVLPIWAGFSPLSRRLITASMPCWAICEPKSSR